MRISIIALLAFCLLAMAALSTASAHCDTIDGPVVKAAQNALDTGDANLILIWVQEKDEAEIRDAFNKTLAVRKLSPEAKDLADIYFFETVVRVHRAGEGEPYTGLKPDGLDIGQAVPAADSAIENGSPDQLVRLLTDAVQNGTREEYDKVMAKKDFSPDDVKAGREYIEAYVPFIHYVERIYEAAKAPVEGHYPAAGNHSEEKLAHAEDSGEEA